MPRLSFGKPFATSAFLLVGACLSANPGSDESSDPLGTSGSSGADASTSGETTLGGIMTTTVEPETGSSSGGEDETAGETSMGSSETTEAIPPKCGDGVINAEDDEECDNGGANADDAACTSTCKNAACGDGLLQMNKEVCDDGTNDGAYGGCLADCSALAPFCGDGIVDVSEKCDDDSPETGCLKGQCKYAKSCLDLKQAWEVLAPTGVYPLHPKEGLDLEAYCDMDADQGGYTFVKFGSLETVGAKQAEKKCAEIGMQLLIPRTAAHLTATTAAAADTELDPQEGQPATKASNYLKIFGIYPKVKGASCVGAAFNKETCPEWKASDGQAFWISGAPLAPTEPGLDNCLGCSMVYTWDDDELIFYETVLAGDVGAESTHFMCDVGDKRGMN